MRKELIQRQSEEVDIPVNLVELPESCSNDEYESTMADVLADYRDRGIDTMVFGDVHLQASESINAFHIDGTYMFKQYFEGDEVFGELQQYYNSEGYRFGVPEAALDEVRDLLAEHFYELTVVEDVKPFCVVKRKYSEHPELLFRNAVVQRSEADYNVFLMKDEASVEQAVNHGAARLAETELEIGI